VSAGHDEADYDLNLVNGAADAGDGGIPAGRALVAFAEAVLGADDGVLRTHRTALQEALGDAALVDAAGVVANFNAIDRVADACGIPLDPSTEDMTADMRASLGLDDFAVGRDHGAD
jgi:alkylhydroperoxidase family enzyme